jgi:Transport protein particle (TRAPP) component
LQENVRRRDKLNTHMRPVTVLEVVKQVSNMLWPYLFGKQPDSLQRDDEVRLPAGPCLPCGLPLDLLLLS